MSHSDGSLDQASDEDDFPSDKTINSIKKAAGTRTKRGSKHAMANEDGNYSWTADYKRSWDAVQEDASGSITSAVEGIIEAGKRRRLLKDATPVQRGIIRHVVLVLDFGVSMAEKDLRPSRHEASINYSCEFITEFFEQNPISQLALIGMLDGVAVSISGLSGNPQDHIAALQQRKKQECKGDASLQNALEMARATLFNVPAHGTREILMIYGALVSSDPGDIHKTISSLVTDEIHVKIIGLAASLAICKEIVRRTNGGRSEGYSVILNEYHFKELLMSATTPPPQTQSTSSHSLIMIGFPNRLIEPAGVPTLCACHGTLTRDTYHCPRCASKVCTLPAECPSCALTLILSTHLARSYHHLFPLRNWDEVTWRESTSRDCFACLAPFPRRARDDAVGAVGAVTGARKDERGGGGARGGESGGGGQASESGRYRCPSCLQHFCIDCDLFAHEVMFECPGCQAGAGRRRVPPAGRGVGVNGSGNGIGASGGSGGRSVNRGVGLGKEKDMGLVNGTNKSGDVVMIDA